MIMIYDAYWYMRLHCGLKRIIRNSVYPRTIMENRCITNLMEWYDYNEAIKHDIPSYAFGKYANYF